MEDEIEVGEYVRTDKGYIVKIDKKKKNLQMLKFLDVEYGNILKHSKNIIDLIEEGDYVNGKYVYSIGTAIGNLPIINHTDGTFTPSNLIESIVTKEQMAQMEYKVKE